MSVEVKPYLKEVTDLYDRIVKFETGVSLGHPWNGSEKHCGYMDGDIDTVLEALSEELDFAPAELEGLRESMESGSLDFLRMISGPDTINEDEYQLLYIVGRPFFRAMGRLASGDIPELNEGHCPVCGAVPSLSVIGKESRRKYVCSFCGTVSHYARIGCSSCGTENPDNITVITLEGEEGTRADACGKCMSYCKTFDSSLTDDNSMDMLDIISLPVDIVLQEKGFRRHSPNPVGLRIMS